MCDKTQSHFAKNQKQIQWTFSTFELKTVISNDAFAFVYGIFAGGTGRRTLCGRNIRI